MGSIRALRLVVAACVAGALVAPAAQADSSRLDAFVRDVLSRSPALHAEQLRHRSFRTESTAEGLWPDPMAMVMVDRIPGAHGGEMPMIRYQLEQMLPWPGKLGMMRSGAEWRARGAAATVEVRRLDLVVEAKRGYLMLFLNAQQRQINRGSYDLVTSIARAAGARYAGGTGGHHELVRAEVERNALEVELVALDGERASIVAMLNALRNAPPGEQIPDPEPFETAMPKLVLEDLFARALAQRPELRQMETMRRETKAMANLARRERYPDLTVGAWWNQMLGEPDSAGAMVGVTLPVVGVRRQNRRAGALDVRAESVSQDAEAMRAMIRFQVADAARKIQTAERSLEFLRAVAMPKATENVEVTLATYSTGSVDMVGLLESRRALQSVALAISGAQVEREIALAELDRAVGNEPERSGR